MSEKFRNFLENKDRRWTLQLPTDSQAMLAFCAMPLSLSITDPSQKGNMGTWVYWTRQITQKSILWTWQAIPWRGIGYRHWCLEGFLGYLSYERNKLSFSVSYSSYLKVDIFNTSYEFCLKCSSFSFIKERLLKKIICLDVDNYHMNV